MKKRFKFGSKILTSENGILQVENALENDKIISFRKAVMDRFQLASKKCLSHDALMAATNAQIEFYADRIAGGLVTELRTWILAGQHRAQERDVYEPLNWFEHLKRDYAPQWVLQRFPVKFRLVEKIMTHGPTYVCPHSNQKWANSSHIEFMMQGAPSWKS